MARAVESAQSWLNTQALGPSPDPMEVRWVMRSHQRAHFIRPPLRRMQSATVTPGLWFSNFSEQQNHPGSL